MPIPDVSPQRDEPCCTLPLHVRTQRSAVRRLAPLARCALAITPVFALVVAPTFVAGCGPSNAASATPGARTPAEKQIDELVEAGVPLPGDLTSDILDRHWHRWQELLANAKAGGREVGLAALQRLREGAPKDENGIPYQSIELGLLATAAYAAPEDARPLLDALITQYGAGLHLRTEALLYLADTQPEHALELIEPWVTKTRPNQTMPPAEFIVASWEHACELTGRSPVPQLADVATNLFYDQTGRVRAVKLLGKYRDPLGAQALQAILIESTGDGYLRRMAAQSLRDTLSQEDACAVFRIVSQREADLNMLKFLADLLEKLCGD